MHSSKTQLLQALKGPGRFRVDELAVAVGIAPMTVRQHMATMARNSLVGAHEKRQRLGGPHLVYFPFEGVADGFVAQNCSQIRGLTLAGRVAAVGAGVKREA